ncbi:MAG: hypothetical protein IPL28_24480 [Chloroflexi bacterium]|nr:hypothetical protein [Chloroflexota bacterium]
MRGTLGTGETAACFWGTAALRTTGCRRAGWGWLAYRRGEKAAYYGSAKCKTPSRRLLALCGCRVITVVVTAGRGGAE